MSTAELYALFSAHPKVTTDSRLIPADCLFFALRGSTFNGNRFAADALAQGAAYAVVDDETLAGKPRHIFVPDTLQALQDLARHHRRQFDIPVVGITGSNGKTTTKELVAGALGAHYRVHFTRGNFNNHIGVPLTLLSMPNDTQIAVIEMGANHQGEIDLLSRIAEPTHGLITNIGKAHLEGFGGIEGVKKGKSELYRFLAGQGGTAFINADEPFLADLAEPVQRKVFYGRTPPAKVASGSFIKIDMVADQPTLRVTFPDENGKTLNVESQLTGAYNFGNISTAIALGWFFQVPGQKIAAAIEAYVPADMRSQVVHQGSNTIILDAYNANPTSTKQAILSFARMPASAKIAILGDMLELGEYAQEEHADIAALAAAQGFSQVVLAGPLYAQIPLKAGTLHFPDVEALVQWFRAQRFHDTHILIKGSRGMRLERLLEGN